MTAVGVDITDPRITRQQWRNLSQAMLLTGEGGTLFLGLIGGVRGSTGFILGVHCLPSDVLDSVIYIYPEDNDDMRRWFLERVDPRT